MVFMSAVSACRFLGGLLLYGPCLIPGEETFCCYRRSLVVGVVDGGLMMMRVQ